jgi:hypothetical protein
VISHDPATTVPVQVSTPSVTVTSPIGVPVPGATANPTVTG